MDNGAKATETTGTGVNWLFVGLLVGAAAAGVATLLLAPKSGTETRDGLKAEIAATQDMLQRWTREAQERADSFTQVLRATFTPEMQHSGNGKRETVMEERQTG